MVEPPVGCLGDERSGIEWPRPSWYGYDGVRQLHGSPPNILLLPLVDQTLRHAGVAVRAPSGRILMAGDAHFYHHEIDAGGP